MVQRRRAVVGQRFFPSAYQAPFLRAERSPISISNAKSFAPEAQRAPVDFINNALTAKHLRPGEMIPPQRPRIGL